MYWGGVPGLCQGTRQEDWSRGFYTFIGLLFHEATLVLIKLVCWMLHNLYNVVRDFVKWKQDH